MVHTEAMDIRDRQDIMTKIEWTDETWNPVTGCTKVSAGCANCYAEVIARRFWGERDFTDVQCHPERLEQPLKWKKPRRVFVSSMSDLFHEDVPMDFIINCFEVMRSLPRHTFQVLTKRPIRMMNYYRGRAAYYPNVWLGMSVENQQNMMRVPYLRDWAGVKFVSLEPLLNPIDLGNTDNIDWVIVGCESGPKARPMNLDWVRDIRDQCVAADIPFFFKQRMADGKKIEMPELDGKVWAMYPGDSHHDL